MKKEIEIYELIENYLTGKLSSEESLQVERRINEDSSFAKELTRQKALHSVILEGSLLDIRNDLQKIHHDTLRVDQLRNPGVRKYLLPTIGIILVLGFLTFLMLSRKDSQIETPKNIIISIDSISEMDSKNDTTLSIDTDDVSTRLEIELPAKRKVDPLKSKVEIILVEKDTIEILEKMDTIFQSPINTINDPKPLPASPAKNIQPTQNRNDPEKTVNCEEVKIEAELKLKESCSEKPTGGIQIISGSITGGKPPYHVSIDNAENYYEQLNFDNLFARNYSIWIKDDNGCSSTLGYHRLNSVECTYEDAFAPLLDERWQVPSRGKQAVLNIYNQQGSLVFKVEIEAGNSFSWDGNSLSNQPLPMGLYPFVLELKDVENLIGTITIVK